MGPSAQGRYRRWPTAIVAVAALLLAACGGTSDDASPESGGAPASTEPLRLGYSAWPGWFPWAVADQAGIFDEFGVDVELIYFSDYLSSLDALAAGQLDANSQTLNDTLVSVSAGSDQRAVIVNDA